MKLSLPSSKKSVKVCTNHLAAFYEALKEGNTRKVRSIEHVLTPVEECVACAYLFKAKNEAKLEAESFLAQEGIIQHFKAVEAAESNFSYWSTRILLFAAVFLILFLIEWLIKKIIWLKATQHFWPGNIFEWVGVLVVTLMLFMIIDSQIEK